MLGLKHNNTIARRNDMELNVVCTGMYFKNINEDLDDSKPQKAIMINYFCFLYLSRTWIVFESFLS